MLQFQQRADLLLKDPVEIIQRLDSAKVDLIHSATGLSGEAGEVLEIAKKHVFHGKPINREKLVNELGDTLFYLAGVMNALDITFEEVNEVNEAKLSARYPEGYSDEAANAPR